ncbi:MAG: NADH-quinone oxidoreductase subunit M [Candidatus Thorarchaeota archaeon]|nr:NADH-quinone oxidoreductase subunit M [Candidatus Thorarchaeota archaeon]
MLTLPLNILFIFAVTTPAVGYLGNKYGYRNLCGVYALIGVFLAGYAVYDLYLVASGGVYVFPSDFTRLFAHFRIDTLGFFMAFIQVGLGLLATLYSIRYMEEKWPTPLYYSSLLAMIGGMMGVVFAADLFTLFVFWELMCISSYMLVAFDREWEPIEAGLKYLLMSAAGSATFLYGISLIYGFAGSLDFVTLASTLGQAPINRWFNFTYLLIFVGLGIKAAVVPLHTWLPDAHSAAPTPISAMLSGIVIETGLYAMFRVSYTALASIHVEWMLILAVFSIITMTLGNLSALLQKDLKRLLAYSSIAHIGYMLVGLSIGTELALTGSFLHIFNHALMKGTAFLCTGAILYRLGTRDLDKIGGVGRKMPITAIAFGVSLLALSGLPGLNGFVSELTLVLSTLEEGFLWLGIAVILNTAISAGYYLRIFRTMMQSPPTELAEEAEEAPVSMLVPICLLATFIVVFGIWPDIVLDLARQAAQGLLGLI